MMAENRILLFDPFKNLLNVYGMILGEESYVVETASNLKDAYHLLKTKPYSVIISEYIRPFEGGDAMIQWVKENTPETYLIIVTKHDIDEATYEKLFGIGVDDLILKPYSSEKILAHIKKGLKQRKLILRNQDLEKQSLLDPISQRIQNFIFNPLYFRKCLREELKRAKRHQHPLSLLLLKIPSKEELADYFENFFIELLNVLRLHIREEDMLGRENDNLGILLPETDQIGSQALVQRLSNLIQTHAYFRSNEVLWSSSQALSFQSFTYPERFNVPESLMTVSKDLNKEYLHH
jgi:PleD family two-component response regulator